MKVLTVLMTAGLSLNAFAILPDVVEAPIDHVFVPNGFDNNDHVEVVVTGKTTEISEKMDKKTKKRVLYNFIKRHYALKLPEKCF